MLTTHSADVRAEANRLPKNKLLEDDIIFLGVCVYVCVFLTVVLFGFGRTRCWLATQNHFRWHYAESDNVTMDCADRSITPTTGGDSRKPDAKQIRHRGARAHTHTQSPTNI